MGSVLASLSPGEQLMKRAEEPEKRRRAGLYLGSPMNWTVRGRWEVGHAGRYKRTTGLESRDLPASYPTSASGRAPHCQGTSLWSSQNKRKSSPLSLSEGRVPISPRLCTSPFHNMENGVTAKCLSRESPERTTCCL